MTLTDALKEYDWMRDPWKDNVARVGGPDNLVCIIVEEKENEFDCWLRCSKTENRLSNVLRVGTADEVHAVVEELYCLREQVGDCPLCGMPMGTDGTQATCQNCGHLSEIVMGVVEMQEVAV